MNFSGKRFIENTFAFFSCIVLIFTIATLWNCGTSATPTIAGDTQKNVYFDLKGFMEKEINRLSAVTSFSKSVSVNGEKEEKVLNQLDLINELNAFSDADLNRPAWSGKYEIDSTFNQNRELTNLSYAAKEEKLKTRQMTILFENNKVSKILIEIASNSSIASTQQSLVYQPQKGYSIESRQDVSILNPNHFQIVVVFQ